MENKLDKGYIRTLGILYIYKYYKIKELLSSRFYQVNFIFCKLIKLVNIKILEYFNLNQTILIAC